MSSFHPKIDYFPNAMPKAWIITARVRACMEFDQVRDGHGGSRVRYPYCPAKAQPQPPGEGARLERNNDFAEVSRSF